MKQRKSSTAFIFLGAVLTFCFVVGLMYEQNPETFVKMKEINVPREQFAAFCGSWYPILGLIGIPMFLISLILSLIREKKEDKQ